MAKGLLPFHGLGSGIKRAIDEWSEIDFIDNRDECLFIAIIHRKEVGRLIKKEAPFKASEKIIQIIGESPQVTISELSALIGVSNRSIERNIQNLRSTGMLKRAGGRKMGYWEISSYEKEKNK